MIKISSKRLKPGDKIIRIAPLVKDGQIAERSFLGQPITVTRVTTHHTIFAEYDGTLVLDHLTWDDGNWTRWK